MRETLTLALLSLLISLASLAAVAWAAVRAALDGLFVEEILTLDGLLMISVGLLVSAMFAFCFLWLARDARLLDYLKSRRPGSSSEENRPGPS